ncbi:hypothetical protein C1645_815298 [Glomus cerebriforme]|uniref:Uncharacterized protein n=1 Tax=Glomus cerebriforme TaxID=658196 RepID=A0A397TP17_9GLOM|nr:hypothetical protein C1645_815298 [Glomus cerebriforme]
MSNTDTDSILLTTTSEFSCSAYSLSEINNKKFKSILVYLIHHKFSNGFKRRGCQLVSLVCITGYQALNEILNNQLWCQKFYDNEQQTYVVLFNNLPQHLKNNPLAITIYCAKSITTKRQKLKYNPEKVTIE